MRTIAGLKALEIIPHVFVSQLLAQQEAEEPREATRQFVPNKLQSVPLLRAHLQTRLCQEIPCNNVQYDPSSTTSADHQAFGINSEAALRTNPYGSTFNVPSRLTLPELPPQDAKR